MTARVGERLTDFEKLVLLYQDILRFDDSADSEGYAADNALMNGYTFKSEQHYRYSRLYRQRAEAAEVELQAVLRKFPDPKRIQVAAEAEARRRLYGSAEAARRPFID